MGKINSIRLHAYIQFRDHSSITSACFWPYQQTSAFPYTHLKHDISISSYYPPTSIIIFSLINKAKIGKKCPKKGIAIQSSGKKSKKSYIFLANAKKSVFPRIYFSYFSLTSAFCHTHNLSANISNWPSPPIHLFDDVILDWFLTLIYVNRC